MTDSSQLTPVYQDLAPEQALTDAELSAARNGAYLQVPPGWDVVSGYRTSMTVSFADPRTLSVPAGTIMGYDDLPRATVLASERVPQVYLLLARGSEMVQIEVSETATPLAKNWASATTEGGTMTQTSIGRVGVGGTTAVIDAGDRLIRAEYNFADVVPRAKADDYRHVERAARGAEEFLASLLK